MKPITEQVDEYRRHANDAIDLIIAFLETHREVITRRQVLRMTTIGADEYGDTSFSLDAERLALELTDELCDASFYGSIGLGQHGLGGMLLALGLTKAAA